MKTLIVVDMQNDFIDGSLGTPEAEAVVPKVKDKIKQYQNDGGLIIFTRDTHNEDYLETREGKYLPIEHCIKDTDGWQIPSDIDIENAVHKNKLTFGFKMWEDVLFDIEEDDTIELIGLCTDICVVSNALILKAIFPENEIIVDAGCCAGVTPEKHKAALEVMKSCQINVINE